MQAAFSLTDTPTLEAEHSVAGGQQPGDLSALLSWHGMSTHKQGKGNCAPVFSACYFQDRTFVTLVGAGQEESPTSQLSSTGT